MTLDGFEPAFLPGKFEAGTPPIVPAIGLGAAIDYLNAVGLEAIAEHERRLTRRAHEVSALGGVRIVGPAPEHKAGIVSFVFDCGRPHAHDVAQMLDRSRRGGPRRTPLRHAPAPAARACRPPPGPASISTTRSPKSTSSAKRWNRSSASSGGSSRPAGKRGGQIGIRD